MINPRRLAFDFDGVVANTMQLFLDILKDIYGINHIVYQDIVQYQLEACLDIDPEIIHAATDRIISGDYPCCLQPIDGAEAVLKRLSAFSPVRMVTARPYPGPMDAWLQALLPPADHQVEITSTGSYDAKPPILKAAGIDYFVEDRLDTCFLLAHHDIKPVLFSQPWNRRPHPFVEVAGWDQLEALIQWN